MNNLDVCIVFLWILLTSALGIVAGLRTSIEGFWANKRGTHLWFLVFTIVATQVGGGTIIGICSSTYESGIGFGLVAVISTVTGFLAVALLAPWAKRFGDKHHAYTLPEVLLRRYGRSVQIACATLVLFAYLSLLAGQFLSISVLLGVWTGWGAKATLFVSAVLVIGYSAFAGLRGDIVTDIAHFWAMAISLFAVILPFVAVRLPIVNALERLDPRILSPVTFGGYTYLIVGVLLGALIPVVSMEMWMRVYAASDQKTARRCFIWSSIVVVPFYLLPLLLGLIATTGPMAQIKPDSLLVEMLFRYLPHGFLGIAVASLFAVVVSSANTMIIVLGAVLYRDILARSGEDAPREIRLSRLLTLGGGVAGFAFALVVPSIVQQILNAYFVIGMIAPVLLGITLWRRATKAGAISALAVGGLLTVALLPIMPRTAFLPGLVISIILFFVVSLLTKHSAEENLNMGNNA